MSDTASSPSQHVYTAAHLEKIVYHAAQRLLHATLAERHDLVKQADQAMDRMETLNKMHFGASTDIAGSIVELRRALHELAEATPPKIAMIWPALELIGSTETGFGTEDI